MAVIFQDTLDRANATSLGTSSSGQAYISIGGCVAGVFNNQAYGVSGNHETGCQGYSGPKDGKVTMTFANNTVNDWSTRLVFRALDENNLWHIQIHGSGYGLERLVGGAWTTKFNYTGGKANGDVIEVTFNGPSITVKRNGATIITDSDTTHQNNTIHGFSFYASVGSTSGSKVDDFKIEDLATGGPTTYTQTVGSATVTPSSAVTKRLTLSKLVGGGTVTPTGSLLQNITGLAISAGGAILTPIGSLAKRTYKGVGGVITPIGNAAKGLFKSVGGGSVAPTGTVSSQLNPDPPPTILKTAINWVMKGLKNFFD